MNFHKFTTQSNCVDGMWVE